MTTTKDLVYICGNCDFNYRVIDQHGLMDYCVITDQYEDEMRQVVGCDHHRVAQVYDTD